MLNSQNSLTDQNSPLLVTEGLTASNTKFLSKCHFQMIYFGSSVILEHVIPQRSLRGGSVCVPVTADICRHPDAELRRC